VTPEEALDLWSEFPVDADPRPLVLTDATVRVPGFQTGEAKLAFLNGAVRSEVELPPGVLARLRHHHPLVRRQDHALIVRSVEHTTAGFMTDRGPRELSAYRIDLEGALDRLLVLDPETEATNWWPTGLDLSLREITAGPARLQKDEQTLELSTIGSPPEYSEARVSAVLESAEAVLVLTEETMHEHFDAIPAIAAERLVVARLTAPLGDRVLVHPSGRAVPVLSA
jgi:hypothetical protein